MTNMADDGKGKAALGKVSAAIDDLGRNSGRDSVKRELLTGLLSTAVPLEIATMRHWTDDDRLQAGLKSSSVIASRGDLLLYRSRKRGETAKVFVALARGLAVLAYRAGGVGFCSLHWCVGSEHQGTQEPTPCLAEVQRERKRSGP